MRVQHLLVICFGGAVGWCAWFIKALVPVVSRREIDMLHCHLVLSHRLLCLLASSWDMLTQRLICCLSCMWQAADIECLVLLRFASNSYRLVRSPWCCRVIDLS